MISTALAIFTNLACPDFIVLAIILAVLVGFPAAIAIAILFIIRWRSKEPPRPPGTGR